MNSPSLSSTVKISKNILFRELDGEAVLLNSETGVYFGLDASGTAAWQLMQQQKNLHCVLNALLEEYEVDAKTCREDLLKLASTLQKNGLVEITEG